MQAILTRIWLLGYDGAFLQIDALTSPRTGFTGPISELNRTGSYPGSHSGPVSANVVCTTPRAGAAERAVPGGALVSGRYPSTPGVKLSASPKATRGHAGGLSKRRRECACFGEPHGHADRGDRGHGTPQQCLSAFDATAHVESMERNAECLLERPAKVTGLRRASWAMVASGISSAMCSSI